jgi:hypothetical protein
MLRAPQHQRLELFVCNQFLQLTIDSTEAKVGEPLADFIVNFDLLSDESCRP